MPLAKHDKYPAAGLLRLVLPLEAKCEAADYPPPSMEVELYIRSSLRLYEELKERYNYFK